MVRGYNEAGIHVSLMLLRGRRVSWLLHAYLGQ